MTRLDGIEREVEAALGSAASADLAGSRRRPVVLMTMWRRRLDTYVSDATDLYTLAAEYVTAVRTSGGIPVLLPHVDVDDVPTVLDGVDALVVCGGGDVDPASYGAEPVDVHDQDPGADDVELAVVEAARRRNLPTLAICRGMQLLNVAYGGDLRQDVTAPGGPHPPIPEPAAVLGLRHDVEVAAGSRLAGVLGAGTRTVNAIHHQGVGRLGDDLAATAQASDGLVEALEPADWPACLAVQWHPEKIYDTERALFDWLVATAGAATAA